MELISRQAAIDIERNATVDTNPSHFEAHQKFTQFMDDAEVSSFGRWQWSNGFNTALTAVGIDLKKLPSTQPEQRTGKWIEYEQKFMTDRPFETIKKHVRECSLCRTKIAGFVGTMRYCPNCGSYNGGENEI